MNCLSYWITTHGALSSKDSLPKVMFVYLFVLQTDLVKKAGKNGLDRFHFLIKQE